MPQDTIEHSSNRAGADLGRSLKREIAKAENLVRHAGYMKTLATEGAVREIDRQRFREARDAAETQVRIVKRLKALIEE